MTDVLGDLRARAKARRARIVLPETRDPRTMAARALLEREGLCEVVWVEDPAADPRLPAVAALLHERRRQKGLDEAMARELAAQPLMFGAGLVALGHADAGVAGAAHATADVIRAGLFCLGTSPAIPLVSSMFLMVRGTEVLSFSPGSIEEAPERGFYDTEVGKTFVREHVLRSFAGARIVDTRLVTDAEGLERVVMSGDFDWNEHVVDLVAMYWHCPASKHTFIALHSIPRGDAGVVGAVTDDLLMAARCPAAQSVP